MMHPTGHCVVYLRFQPQKFFFPWNQKAMLFIFSLIVRFFRTLPLCGSLLFFLCSMFSILTLLELKYWCKYMCQILTHVNDFAGYNLISFTAHVNSVGPLKAHGQTKKNPLWCSCEIVTAFFFVCPCLFRGFVKLLATITKWSENYTSLQGVEAMYQPCLPNIIWKGKERRHVTCTHLCGQIIIKIKNLGYRRI